MCVFSEPHDPVQRELTALDQEIEKQSVQLREWQMQELLKLRQQLHSLERQKHQTHLQEVETPHNVTHASVHLSHSPIIAFSSTLKVTPDHTHEFLNTPTRSSLVTDLQKNLAALLYICTASR